jgi:cation transport regulator
MTIMSYQINQDILPVHLRDRLPQEAQELYRAAFQSGLDWYGDELKAHEAAWRAVRSQAASLNSTIGKGLEPIFSNPYQLRSATSDNN